MRQGRCQKRSTVGSENSKGKKAWNRLGCLSNSRKYISPGSSAQRWNSEHGTGKLFFFFHEASGTFRCSWKREPFLYGSKNHTHRTQHSLRKIYSQPIRKDYAKRYILRFRYYVFELRSLEGKKQIQPQICKLSQPILDSEGRESESRSVLIASLWPHGLYRPWNSPDQNAGVGSLSVLQGIFPTQGSNPVSLIEDGFFISWATREA